MTGHTLSGVAIATGLAALTTPAAPRQEQGTSHRLSHAKTEENQLGERHADDSAVKRQLP